MLPRRRALPAPAGDGDDHRRPPPDGQRDRVAL